MRGPLSLALFSVPASFLTFILVLKQSCHILWMGKAFPWGLCRVLYYLGFPCEEGGVDSLWVATWELSMD
jgi:hypothetical protein